MLSAGRLLPLRSLSSPWLLPPGLRRLLLLPPFGSSSLRLALSEALSGSPLLPSATGPRLPAGSAAVSVGLSTLSLSSMTGSRSPVQAQLTGPGGPLLLPAASTNGSNTGRGSDREGVQEPQLQQEQPAFDAAAAALAPSDATEGAAGAAAGLAPFEHTIAAVAAAAAGDLPPSDSTEGAAAAAAPPGLGPWEPHQEGELVVSLELDLFDWRSMWPLPGWTRVQQQVHQQEEEEEEAVLWCQRSWVCGAWRCWV
jgi:hypothetical protein